MKIIRKYYTKERGEYITRQEYSFGFTIHQNLKNKTILHKFTRFQKDEALNKYKKLKGEKELIDYRMDKICSPIILFSNIN